MFKIVRHCIENNRFIYKIECGKRFLQHNLMTGKLSAVYKVRSIDVQSHWNTQKDAERILDIYNKGLKEKL